MIPGEKEDKFSIRIHVVWVESWRMPVHGTAVPCMDPGPLEQQRLIPHRSPPVRPGVTSPKVTCLTPNCAAAPCKEHQAVSQPGAVGCRHRAPCSWRQEVGSLCCDKFSLSLLNGTVQRGQNRNQGGD